MAIGKSFHAAVLGFALLCGTVLEGHAQRADTGILVSVSIRLIGQGATTTLYQNISGYYLMASVTDRQDTAITFWIMSCGWPYSNWVTNNDSAHVGWQGCDGNIPIEIHLLPGYSISLSQSKTKRCSASPLLE